MAPAWNQLGEEFASSTSVVVGDADCTASGQSLCSDFGVQGYPTIKTFKQDGDMKKGEDYSGGRDFDSMKKHVLDNLEVKCDVAVPDGCTEKEKKFLAKFKAKSADDIAKQKTRLEGMKGKKMEAALKGWLLQRLNILTQLSK